MMKATGMNRKVDELGRIVLPAEIRQSLGIKTKDALEIFIDDESIVLKKYNPGCTFCKSMDGMTEFGDKRICAACLQKIKEI